MTRPSIASETAGPDYRGLSLWHDAPDLVWTPSDRLTGPRDVDVAIVGGGYTGLWTAYYLAKADPSLRIAVLEREVVGFGASGRNGGWCSAIFPATLRKVAAGSSRDAARRMQLAMNDTVGEIEKVIGAEGIACDFAPGGYVSVARNAAQWTRAQAEVAGWREWGFGEDQMRLLSAAEATERLGASRVQGATFTPHCAALHPSRLVRGLAEVVRGLGVRVHEGTAVYEILPGRAATAQGEVRAGIVVRATEGFTAQLPGLRRTVVPMYSLMVATEPLSDGQWAEIGLRNRETFSDKRHLRIYGQRTADGRLAFGGRGAPYHLGSRVRPSFDRDPRVHEMLRGVLRDLLPAVGGADFTHAWGGNLGIPRDWYPSLSYDRASGLAHAGGYVGDGVATANLASRTLADLIAGNESDLVTLPWLSRQSPKWEPEPLRWIGINAVTQLFARADRTEARTGHPSGTASAFWKVLGH
ncbi:MAG: FAD-binding oxidoreductase [Actinomycetota bacterium]|nr:FAD-binding oxidoreductase [Actinomycetota bacterium]